MEDTLDALDRATMATWKASNFLMWGGAALVTALLLHTVGDELVQRFHRVNLFSLNDRPMPGFGTWQFLAPSYGYKAFIAIIVGASIGLMVGSKVLRRQARIASIVAAAYVLVALFVLETSFQVVHGTGNGADPSITGAFSRHGLPSGAREWSYSALTLISVAVAPLVARLVAKRRGGSAVSSGTLG